VHPLLFAQAIGEQVEKPLRLDCAGGTNEANRALAGPALLLGLDGDHQLRLLDDALTRNARGGAAGEQQLVAPGPAALGDAVWKTGEEEAEERAGPSSQAKEHSRRA